MSQLHVLDLRNNSFDRLPNQFTQYPGLQLKDVYLSSKYATFIQQQKKTIKRDIIIVIISALGS